MSVYFRDARILKFIDNESAPSPGNNNILLKNNAVSEKAQDNGRIWNMRQGLPL